jgi:hypothetical protein
MNPERADVSVERTDALGLQRRHKQQIPKRAVVSGKQKDL